VTQLGVLIRQRDMDQRRGTQPNPAQHDLPFPILLSPCRRPSARPPVGPALGPPDKSFEIDYSALRLRFAACQVADIYTPFQGRHSSFAQPSELRAFGGALHLGDFPIASALATQRFCLIPRVLCPRTGTPVGDGEDLPSLPEPPAQSHSDGGHR